MSDLNQSISIFIPSLDSKGDALNAIKRREILQLARMNFCEEYGGFTEVEALGGWRGESGQVVTEQINIITSFYSKELSDVLESVTELALWVKKELDQECITVKQNEEVYFI